MTTRISLQPAFVLHTRPYRETSLLVDLLTYRHGRIAAVARSARRSRSRFRAVLRSFDAILVSWTGNGDLVSLTQAEHTGMVCDLRGESLVCGMYMNELLVRLLTRHDPCTDIFTSYQKTIAALVNGSNQGMLRLFELQLLDAIGYGVNCEEDVHGDAIVAGSWYRYLPERGFMVVAQDPVRDTIMGHEIQSIAQRTLEGDDVLAVAKRITRQALSHAMSHRPIKSRELLTHSRYREKEEIS